ncbi:MAG: PRTRC system ThiF family protein [Bacteroidales bacterium]|nr:PRTRC system ThiF family protein [Bacteroidales bacterium]
MNTLALEKRHTVELGDMRQNGILLVGCGGTGSFLALHLARLAWHLRERNGQSLPLTFVDPDRVELQNVGRQNFCPAEIGQYKAWTLMRRYNAAFGLDIQAHTQPFDREMAYQQRVRIVAGCVDNGAARSAIADAVLRCNGKVWWLDAGNHEFSGQILLGNSETARPQISPVMRACTDLPLPSVTHPELLEIHPRGELAGESCAELALRDAQSLMINQMMAGWMANYLTRLLVSRDLDVQATYIDLVTGAARSVAITEEAGDAD